MGSIQVLTASHGTSALAQPGSPLSWDDAGRWVQQNVPFPEVVPDELLTDGWNLIERTIAPHLPGNATIFDFGCGTCDMGAYFSKRGYRVIACDDLNDPWHLRDGNQEKIINFARLAGVDFRLTTGDLSKVDDVREVDCIIAHHVFEHFHESPRLLLTEMVGWLKPGGLIVIGVPNAVNLRKRLLVLLGKTNYPHFGHFWWYGNPWRGHVREYVKSDLQLLCYYMKLEIIALRGYHYMLGRLPKWARTIWKAATAVSPNGRDSWLLVARKPANWVPTTTIPLSDPSMARMKIIRE